MQAEGLCLSRVVRSAPHALTSHAAALAGGQLEALQWLRANGCPWDSFTCSAAAEGGHLALLQWARANACAWDAWTAACIAKGANSALLQWARDSGCPLPSS